MTSHLPPASEIWRLPLQPDHDGKRLDRVLADLLPQISRTRLQTLIRAGKVALDGTVMGSPSAKLAGGGWLEVTDIPAEDLPLAPQAMALDIVFEDDQLVVLNKPAGLVVHPGAGHADGTLVHALLAHCGDSLSGIGGVKRPGIVHRLDKDTTGLLVVAKTDRAHLSLSAQFADHGRTGPLRRAYLALVWGCPRRQSGTIAANLERSHSNREKMMVVPDGRGREAITHYEVLETFAPRAPGRDVPRRTTAQATENEPVASLVRCQLETGRTHQIRIHMAHLGHPLLGDVTYGSGFRTKASRLTPDAAAALAALGRQALHAQLLGFAHPTTGETLTFEQPLPEDFAQLQESLAIS